MSGKNTLHLDDHNFDALVLGADRPVLVDFGAAWCPPCRMIGPAIDALAVELAGRAHVGKIDADASQAIAARYHVMSLPTLLVFRGGAVVDQIIGAVPKARIAEMLERHL